MLLPESVRVPEPFLVMLALLPARMPETVNVILGFDVNVLLEFVLSVIFPVTELAAVAVKLKIAPGSPAPASPTPEMFAEIFKAPVRLVVFVLQVVLLPDKLRFPVPAFAVNEFNP